MWRVPVVAVDPSLQVGAAVGVTRDALRFISALAKKIATNAARRSALRSST